MARLGARVTPSTIALECLRDCSSLMSETAVGYIRCDVCRHAMEKPAQYGRAEKKG
jgi:hypothetical protein